MRLLTMILGVAILAGVASLVIVLRDQAPAAQVSEAGNTSPASPKATKPSKPASASPKASEFTDPCGTFDTVATTPYPVSGYFVIPTADRCTWRRQLEQIHKVGGDTVVRLGFGLSPRFVNDDGQIMDKDGAKVDERYAVCTEDGMTCEQAAEKDLKAANPGNRISWTYVFRTDEQYGNGVFRCPSMEHKVVIGSSVFYRLVAPEDGSDDPTCDFRSKARGYHLILVSAGQSDSLSELLNLGDQFGIKVFPALPMAPRDKVDETRADPRHIGTLTTLTRRIVQDYGDRFAARASLGGVYQPFEVKLRDWPDPSSVQTLQVYTEQHRIVEQELPGKPIMISPYIDARRRVKFSATPKQVAQGFRELALTGVGIIAPQDGRGTGKDGLYWPNLSGQQVDERLSPTVGVSTYKTAYYGSTRDYYREMAAVRDEMAADEGVKVQLWANVEGFEPSADQPCGNQGTRGKTDKPRLDSQVAMAGPYVSKIISYMWSDFFTCGSPSLSSELADDWQRPIAIQAFRQKRQIQVGLQLRGYHLQNSKITLSWQGVETPRVVDSSSVGWYDPTAIQGLPAGVETIWIPVDWTTVPKDVWVKVEVTSPDGRKAAQPVYYKNTD
ncbi:DUF4434 domain-containing protein [Streptosporangiaceae bacterium NEAU-GS5]|nr:DUF4434 domain-containing protein [Streptosporangiaceae bacterium NEAU-GS5]